VYVPPLSSAKTGDLTSSECQVLGRPSLPPGHPVPGARLTPRSGGYIRISPGKPVPVKLRTTHELGSKVIVLLVAMKTDGSALHY